MSQGQVITEPYIKVRQFPLKEKDKQADQLSIKEVYPDKYLTLVQRLAEVFQQLSETAPNAFKGTTLYWIKKQIINSNHPAMTAMKGTKGGQSIWREATSVEVKGQEHSFITRAVWVAIEKIYFSYRTIIIHDAALQMLAGYLSDSTFVSDSQLEHFFKEEVPPRDLTQRLFKKLTQDIIKRFPGWQGVPIRWHFYMNILRQVRNMSCELLDDGQLYTALKNIEVPEVLEKYTKELIKAFEDNRKHLAWEEYIVFLLMLKVKRPLVKIFPKIWNEHIKGKKKPNTLKTPTGLAGLGGFIFTFTVDHFRKQDVKTYQQLSAKEAWQDVKKALNKRIERSRQAFKEAFPKEARTWVNTLTEQGIKACFDEITHSKRTKGQGAPGDRTFPNKRKVFRAVHRATPLRSFNLRPKGDIKAKDLQPCLEEFIIARAQRKAEELIRRDMVKEGLPQLCKILANTDKFTNKRPTFKKSGFSLGLADQQMFELDLPTKQLSLALVSKGKKKIPHTFNIHDPDERLKPFISPTERRDQTKENDWEALNPTIVEKNGKLEVHIPFRKIHVPDIPPIKLNEPVEELSFGNDLGLHTFNYLAVIRTVSIYKMTKTGQITRELLEREDLAHYSISDLESLHKIFDQQTGTFNNLQKDQGGKYLRHKRNGNRVKQISRTTWGKGHLRELFGKIRKVQAQLNDLKDQYPKTYQDQPAHQKMTSSLSSLWEEYGEVQQAIINGVAAKTKDIVLYWQKRYPKVSIRVQVEDLRWSRHSQKTQAGYYLAHNQKNFFHSRVQQRLAHLLRPYGIGVWRVRAAYTSQTCNYCGHYAKGQRKSRSFLCKNIHHRTPKGQPYTCNSDLNAARNVALFPPLSLTPIIS